MTWSTKRTNTKSTGKQLAIQLLNEALCFTPRSVMQESLVQQNHQLIEKEDICSTFSIFRKNARNKINYTIIRINP